jgi:hypothetical protein
MQQRRRQYCRRSRLGACIPPDLGGFRAAGGMAWLLEPEPKNAVKNEVATDGVQNVATLASEGVLIFQDSPPEGAWQAGRHGRIGCGGRQLEHRLSCMRRSMKTTSWSTASASTSPSSVPNRPEPTHSQLQYLASLQILRSLSRPQILNI